jgi:hypothetical protein
MQPRIRLPFARPLFAPWAGLVASEVSGHGARSLPAAKAECPPEDTGLGAVTNAS